MKVEKRVELSRLRVQDVGTTCVMLVSKFSRAIHQKKGIVIRLHRPHVINTVAAYAACSNDPQLHAIYKQIEHEIRQHLKQEHPNSYDTLVLRISKKTALESQMSQVSSEKSPLTQ